MVGIVILDYNNASDTINCIESVVSYTKEGTYKLFVVENGSNEETVNEIKAFVSTGFVDNIILGDDSCYVGKLPQITLLISQRNDGYAKGNNKALHILDKDEEVDSILILNNDILFTEDIITPLLGYLRKLPDCGIVSPLLRTKDDSNIDYCCARKDFKKVHLILEYLFSFKDFCGIISKYGRERCYLIKNPELKEREYFEMELPSGACMMMDKALFRNIGYFDEGTFLYFEENILYRKLLAKNKRNYLIPRLHCIHLGASTSKKSSTMFTMDCQMKSTAYYLRNYCHSPFLAMYVKMMSNLTKFKIWIKSLNEKKV